MQLVRVVPSFMYGIHCVVAYQWLCDCLLEVAMVFVVIGYVVWRAGVRLTVVMCEFPLWTNYTVHDERRYDMR